MRDDGFVWLDPPTSAPARTPRREPAWTVEQLRARIAVLQAQLVGLTGEAWQLPKAAPEPTLTDIARLFGRWARRRGEALLDRARRHELPLFAKLRLG